MVIALFAIIGILFAVLIGIYYYMSHRMQQEIGDSMESYNPNPNQTDHQLPLKRIIAMIEAVNAYSGNYTFENPRNFRSL